MPLVPLGCAVWVHDKTNKRKSWDPHSSDGWYIGTLSEHYQCFRIYKKDTKTKLISDTVFFKHKYLTKPTITKADEVLKAPKKLAKTLQTNVPVTMPPTNYDELQQIAKIFEEMIQMKTLEET